MKSLCVFLGSSEGVDPRWKSWARKTGEMTAQRGLTLVYGGSDLGLMGALAQGALDQGGQVRGIIPQKLQDRVNHPALTEVLVVETMHQRKAKMHDLADGFLLLPGGIGSMEEFFETLTWLQLGYHHKPLGILDLEDFYGPLANLMNYLKLQGFVSPQLLEKISWLRTWEALDAWLSI